MGVPEQGGRDLISADPLPPGTVYSASVSGDGTVGLYRIEASLVDRHWKAQIGRRRRWRHEGVDPAGIQLSPFEQERARRRT